MKKLKRIRTDTKIENHWEKQLSNGHKIKGCTIKRNEPVEPARKK